MKIPSTLLALSLLITGASAHAGIPAADATGTQYSSVNAINPKEVVFIHGMFVTPKCWKDWEARFQSMGYTVSAPAWPLHEGEVSELREESKLEKLGELTLDEVLDSYRKILKDKPTPPILVGHSMGGLIAQILLSEGLGSAAIVIDSAPANGLIPLEFSFFKANWGAIDPFVKSSKPIQLSSKQFSYDFLNQQDSSLRESIYESAYVPESRKIAKAPTTKAAKIDTSKARGPLLIIAGEKDHIIPAPLNYQNFELFKHTPAYTEFKEFDGRDHWIIAGPGWEEVADFVGRWIERRFEVDPNPQPKGDDLINYVTPEEIETNR